MIEPFASAGALLLRLSSDPLAAAAGTFHVHLSAGSSGRTQSGGCVSAQRKFVQLRLYEQRLIAAAPRSMWCAPGNDEPGLEPAPEEEDDAEKNDMADAVV